MFPYVHRKPSQLEELSVFAPVAIACRSELRLPPIAVVLGKCPVAVAAVPETPVHKDRYSGAREDDVRGSRQIPAMKPEAESARMERATQGELGSARRTWHLSHLMRDQLAQRDGSRVPSSAQFCHSSARV